MAWRCASGAATRQHVSMLLIDAQAPGAKVLVYLGFAVRLLDDVEAAQIDDALDALQEA